MKIIDDVRYALIGKNEAPVSHINEDLQVKYPRMIGRISLVVLEIAG